MLLKNIEIYWNFQNIHKDNREVTITNSSGVRTVIQFGAGYWTFGMISERLFDEGIVLKKIDITTPVEFTAPHTP